MTQEQPGGRDRTRYGERAWNFPTPAEHATLPRSHVHQPVSSPNPVLLGFITLA